MKTPKETPVSWSDVHSREGRKRRRIFFLIFLIAVYLVFIAIVWTVVYSPIFRIKNIEITGNKNVPNDDIMTLAEADIFRGSFVKKALGMRNILIWPRNFSDSILEYYPELKSVFVEKNYRERKIIIVVGEKQPFGAWCLKKTSANPDNIQTGDESNCFWFDENGTIFKRAIGMEGNIFTVVNDYSQKNIGISSKILPDKFIQNAFSIFNAITASGLRVKEIRLNDLALEEMEVDTYDGPKIYFSLRFSANSVPDVINSLKQKLFFGGLQYVDFRVENRAYYK